MQNDPRWQPKSRIAVRLQTVDGEMLEGFVFVPPDMRVSDVVNGLQPFLPFEHGNGQFDLISKVTIGRITPNDAKPKTDAASVRSRQRSRHRASEEPRRRGERVCA